MNSACSTKWKVSSWLSYLRIRGCLVVLALLLSACLPPERQLTPAYSIDYMLGAYDPTTINIWTSDKGFNWEEYLSDLAEHQLNFTQVRLIVDPRVKFDYPAQYGNARGPWPIAPEGSYDYAGWDDVFWDRLDTFLSKAKDLGLTVEVSVLGQETDDLIPIAQRHAYMDKVVEEVAAHDNVVLELCNECGYEGDLQHLYDTVAGRLPIAIDDDNTWLKGQEDPRVSRVNFHHCNSGPDLDIELNYYRGPKPVTQDEDCRGWRPDWPGSVSRSSPPAGTVYDPDYNREVAWRSFVGGAHNLHIDWWMWRGTGDYGTGQPSTAPEETLDYFQHLMDFLTENEIQFSKLSPMTSPYSAADGDLLVEYPGTAYVTAEESATYVVYFVSESDRRDVILNLTMDRARYRWFDPAQGEYVDEGTITGGEGVRISCPGFGHDIVLLLVRVDR